MIKARMAVITMCSVLVAGCSGLLKKDRPVDINKNMPEVADVLSAVQASIDSTASNPNWSNSDDFQLLKQQCDLQSNVAKTGYKAVCRQAYDTARVACRNEKGVNAEMLCADHLRQAQGECGSAPPKPQVCEDLAILTPPRISVARLRFTAASSSSVSAGASLKLISAQAARKAGRISSYDIELIPAPRVERYFAAFGLDEASRNTPEIPPLVRTLQAAITTALNAAVSRKCSPAARSENRRGDCIWEAVPQLVLKSAKYNFEISYEAGNAGGFKWTVSPLKIADGTFEAGSMNTLGNVLTVEIER